MTEGIRPTRQAVDELWRTHGLDRAAASVAIDATITARTLGYSESLANGETMLASREAASREPMTAAAKPELHQLPLISLAVSENAAVEPVVIASASADLEAREVLGEGGMGRVLLARQRSLAREVAVKVIKPEARTAPVIDALVTEAVLTGALEHPNIIPVHALGRDAEGQPLLVMKRIEGVSWSALLRDPEHPAWQRLIERSGDRLVASIEVLMSVCNAVHFAHSRGVIHRDIKPENVMLGAFGEVYLVDWGIATRPSLDRAKTLVGTPSYMAPEMLDGDTSRVDARTDVYLLGATLHEVLTGKPRHEARTLYEAIVLAYESAPFAYGDAVAPELAALANECCAQEPSRRPESAEAVRHRLAEWLRHRGSIELARATHERARALGTITDRTAFDRLATECRFGFVEALRQWADNQVAAEGLRDCLTAMIRAELASDNVVGARSLLDELAARGPLDPSLEAELAKVTARVRERESEAERGRAALREMDESVGYRERLAVLALMVLIAVGIMAYIVSKGGFAAMTVKSSARFSMIVLALMGTALLVFRKKLTANEFNRRVTAVVVVSTVAMAAHRWVALWRGETNLPMVLADDLALVSAVTALGAVTVQRWFYAVSAVFAASSALTYLWPERAHIVFSIGPIGAVLVAAMMQKRGVGTSEPGHRAR
jgi:serine/threonine-protein kinase